MSSSPTQPLLLSAAELHELSGYRNHNPQVRWLIANAIPYFVDSCGRPRVLRRAIEQRLGFRERADGGEASAMTASLEHKLRPRPNFTSLLASTPHVKARRGS